METRTTVPKINLVAPIDPEHQTRVFSDRKWYTRSHYLDELPSVDNVLLIFFYIAIGVEKTKRLVVGYFALPKHTGTAVRDKIDGRFIQAEGGDFSSMSADEGFAVEFLSHIELPYLESKRGDVLWQIDNKDSLKILESARHAHLDSEDPEAVKVVNGIEMMIEDLTTETDAPTPIPAEFEAELNRLPRWLRKELEQCEIESLPQNQEFIKTLVAQSKENPRYRLQAAALQIRQNDYKYILSLANYCYSRAFQLLDESKYEHAAQCFLDAADMYQRDPMITETGWKIEKRVECVRRSIEARVKQSQEEHQYSAAVEQIQRETLAKLGAVRKYLPHDEIDKRIRVAYYVSLGNRLLEQDDTEAFLELLEAAVATDIRDELPKRLIARYYERLSDKFSKKPSPSLEDLEEATAYKLKALQIEEQLYEQKQSDNALMVVLEVKVDYHKLCAYVASRKRDLASFVESIDEAITNAEKVNSRFPSEDRETNVHFLRGIKFSELAKCYEEVADKSKYHQKACDEYRYIAAREGQRRFVRHQMWHCFYELRRLVGAPGSDFETVRSSSEEALRHEWATPLGEQWLRTNTLQEHKGLHISIAAFHEDVQTSELDVLKQTIRAMELHGARDQVRRIANLIYGIQLIRANGLTHERFVGDAVRSIELAIRQLLEGDSISPETLIDDLQIETERTEKEKTETEILSKIRRRKLAEDFNFECKQSVCSPRSKGPVFVDGLHETVTAFLNSHSGGQLIIGVEDSTFEILGIERDIEKYSNSRDSFKQAILGHVSDSLHPTQSSYIGPITITFPEVCGQTLLLMEVKPGAYKQGLYVDKEGTACIRKDARLQRITSPTEKDELARQRREGEGMWSTS